MAGVRQRLVIDGLCASACMVMADRARAQTCITARARFGYHRTSYNNPLPLRNDLMKWIISRGGFPSFTGTMAFMTYQAARQFWRSC